MLRRPNPRLMIDKVLVLPLDTQIQADGFPYVNDPAEANWDTAPDYECQVYNASQSGVLSYDERIAEMLRNQGSTTFTVMFGWPFDETPDVFANAATDPGIGSPQRILRWTHHGKDRRTNEFLELAVPIYLVTDNVQIGPNGGNFAFTISCRLWGI